MRYIFVQTVTLYVTAGEIKRQYCLNVHGGFFTNITPTAMYNIKIIKHCWYAI